MQHTNWYVFSTAQNSFWTCQFWCLLVLLPFFVSPLPHRQNVSLWGLFLRRETKKSLGMRSGEWEGRNMDIMPFLVKKCWTLSAMWAGALVNHPSWNGQTCWKSLEKFTEATCSQSQQCQLVHWYRWVPRTFSYWGEPIIQGTRTPKDNSGFWGSPLYVLLITVSWCHFSQFKWSMEN